MPSSVGGLQPLDGMNLAFSLSLGRPTLGKTVHRIFRMWLVGAGSLAGLGLLGLVPALFAALPAGRRK